MNSALPLRILAFSDLSHEFANTRKLLARIPFDGDDWAPHAKSFTVRKLATHVATLPWWGLSIVTAEFYDFAGPPAPRPPMPTTSDELLRLWDHNIGELTTALDGASDQHLLQTWTLRRGDQVLQQMPRAAALRGWMLNHLIHHRGQLTVYLRLLDLPVPAMYGPSADES